MSTYEPEIAQVWIDRIHEWKEKHGEVPPALIGEAAEVLGRSPRSIKRFLKQGLPKPTGRKRRDLTEVEIEAYFEAYGDCVRAIRILKKRGEAPPHVKNYQRGVKRQLTLMERAYAKGGPKLAHGIRLFLERQEKGRGICFEADHKVVDVYVVPPRGRTPIRPRITLIIETYSRAIAGICISTSPTEAEVLSTLAAAIEHNRDFSPAYGIPEFLRIDNGLEFTASGVTNNAASLGCQVVQTPPYTPNKKGKVERIFRTLDDECCSMMPCYINGPRKKNGQLSESDDIEPYSFDLFVSEVLEWCQHYNFKRKHNELDKRTPAQAWDDDTTIVREATAEDLRRYSLKELNGGRRVTTRGIRAFKKYFISADLEPLIGEKVEVRGLPHDHTKLEVYYMGNFVTTVWPQEELTTEEKDRILANRTKHARKASNVAKRARKSAKRRHQGTTSKKSPRDVTDVRPTPQELANDEGKKGLLDALGLKDRRGGRRAGRRRRGHE